MIDEITLDPENTSLDLFLEKMESLKCRQLDALIIRKGLLAFSTDEWRNILINNCFLKEDKRHFNYSSEETISDWWEISNQSDKADSYAYSKTRQPFHTDNAWFRDAAQINFFAMKKQASRGGEQFLYPVSQIIHDLENEEPLLFKKLTSLPVTIEKGNDGSFYKGPIIDLNDLHPTIRWNYYRTVKSDLNTESMCDSFFQFLENKESSSSVIYLHCQTDDCFVMNDLSILHGRNAFHVEAERDRVLLQSMWKI